MEIHQTTPPAAHETLSSNDTAIYIDVRTPEEFEQGHPEGALNVPIQFPDPDGGRARQNGDFLQVVQRHVEPDRAVFVGCLSGGRSQRACLVLVEAGFSNVTNVRGGFGGARDRTGKTIVEGWNEAGLPVATGQPTGRSYVDLSAGG